MDYEDNIAGTKHRTTCDAFNAGTYNPLRCATCGYAMAPHFVKLAEPKEDLCPRKQGTFEELGKSVGELVDSKQVQYGNSVGKSGEILKILYPNGVQPHQYEDMLLVVRMLDKLSRLAQRGEDGKDLGGESPWRDIAGYGLLGLMQDV